MKSQLERIQELIQVLPEKDAKLATKYLKLRLFDNVLEIVQSDLYKAEKEHIYKEEEIPDVYVLSLTELEGELISYMSYLDIPNNDYEYW